MCEIIGEFSEAAELNLDDIPKPREINEISISVIGQDRAKRALAVAIVHHYKRIRVRRAAATMWVQKTYPTVGSTGVGKTLLAQPWPVLNVPFAIADATS